MLQPTSQTKTWKVDFTADQDNVDMAALSTIRKLDHYSYSEVKVVTLPSPSSQSEVGLDSKPDQFSNDLTTNVAPQNDTSNETECANGMLTCNSPESGFGSEHQYSPKDHVLNVNVPECSTVEEPRDMPQILSVTSLADQKVAITEDYSRDFLMECERTRTKKVFENEDMNANRLRLRHIDQKHVLKLDWSAFLGGDEPTLRTERLQKILNHAEMCRHKKHQVLFGVPALTCCRHKIIKLSDLQDCENWPSKPQEKTTELVASEKLPVRVNNTKDLPTQRFSKRKKAASVSLPDTTDISTNELPTQSVLERKKAESISLPDATEVSPPAVCTKALSIRRSSKRKEAASKVTNQTTAVKETNKQINAIPTKRATTSYDETPAACHTPKTKIADLKPDSITVPPQKVGKKDTKSQPLSRIERLKEVLRKREEDLEKVRRSCGFIS